MQSNAAVPTVAGRERLTRRELARLAAMSGLALPTVGSLLSACGGDDGAAGAKASSLTFVSGGGSYGEILKKTLFEPFERETGISVRYQGLSDYLPQVKLQVESDNVTWDVVDLTGGDFETAVADGLLEPYDYDIVKPASIPEFARKEFGVLSVIWLYVMAWNETEVPTANAPTSWAQFWDTDRYQTKRSLYDSVVDGSILEAALLADGVPMDAIYPLDVERALKSLDKLGRDNIVWHGASQEGVQLLTSGQVGLGTSFNGRIDIARRQDGAKVNFTAEQGIVGGGYFVVPKGAPNAGNAWKLLSFLFSNADVGAEFTKATSYALANVASTKRLPKDIADQLPTSPALQDKVLVKDAAWWGKNGTATTDRFKEWQAS
jgi:putative spermidine/putrescine transport system substrate-binding protein